MTSTQLPLGVDPLAHERALVRIAELEEQVADETAAGERQAVINVEVHRLLDQVCPACRAIVDEAMAEVGDTMSGTTKTVGRRRANDPARGRTLYGRDRRDAG